MSRAVATRPDIIPALAEVFREHGYEGASLALLGDATGLGKGSLYHFFPNGKEEMAAAVLDAIDGWFRDNIFSLLRRADACPRARRCAGVLARARPHKDAIGSMTLGCLSISARADVNGHQPPNLSASVSNRHSRRRRLV
jgi:TetR/AcrR family transcriptional repressor of lmrAB and yxaGH operons